MKIAGINFDHFHMGDLLRYAFDHPTAEIVGISDEQPERMQSAATLFRIPQNRVCTDYRQFLQETKLDGERLPIRGLPKRSRNVVLKLSGPRARSAATTTKKPFRFKHESDLNLTEFQLTNFVHRIKIRYSI